MWRVVGMFDVTKSILNLKKISNFRKLLKLQIIRHIVDPLNPNL